MGQQGSRPSAASGTSTVSHTASASTSAACVNKSEQQCHGVVVGTEASLLEHSIYSLGAPEVLVPHVYPGTDLVAVSMSPPGTLAGIHGLQHGTTSSTSSCTTTTTENRHRAALAPPIPARVDLPVSWTNDLQKRSRSSSAPDRLPSHSDNDIDMVSYVQPDGAVRQARGRVTSVSELEQLHMEHLALRENVTLAEIDAYLENTPLDHVDMNNNDNYAGITVPVQSQAYLEKIKRFYRELDHAGSRSVSGSESNSDSELLAAGGAAEHSVSHSMSPTSATLNNVEHSPDEPSSFDSSLRHSTQSHAGMPVFTVRAPPIRMDSSGPGSGLDTDSSMKHRQSMSVAAELAADVSRLDLSHLERSLLRKLGGLSDTSTHLRIFSDEYPSHSENAQKCELMLNALVEQARELSAAFDLHDRAHDDVPLSGTKETPRVVVPPASHVVARDDMYFGGGSGSAVGFGGGVGVVGAAFHDQKKEAVPHLQLPLPKSRAAHASLGIPRIQISPSPPIPEEPDREEKALRHATRDNDNGNDNDKDGSDDNDVDQRAVRFVSPIVSPRRSPYSSRRATVSNLDISDFDLSSHVKQHSNSGTHKFTRALSLPKDIGVDSSSPLRSPALSPARSPARSPRLSTRRSMNTEETKWGRYASDTQTNYAAEYQLKTSPLPSPRNSSLPSSIQIPEAGTITRQSSAIVASHHASLVDSLWSVFVQLAGGNDPATCASRASAFAEANKQDRWGATIQMSAIEDHLRASGLAVKPDGKLDLWMARLAGDESGDCVRFVSFVNFMTKSSAEDNDMSHNLLYRSLSGHLAVPNFQSFCSEMDTLCEAVKSEARGTISKHAIDSQLPNPSSVFGVSICTVDGQQYHFGDWHKQFPILDCAKPFNYALAVQKTGSDSVHDIVGVEPIDAEGDFNFLPHEKYGKIPRNPLDDAGALAIASMLYPELDTADRFSVICDFWSGLAGCGKMSFDQLAFLREQQQQDILTSLAYMMRRHKLFTAHNSPSKQSESGHSLLRQLLSFYTMCNCVEVNCDSLAVMASCLASAGVCPTNGKTVLDSRAAMDTIKLMFQAGAKSYSGEWAMTVGIPVKSGTQGAVMLVIPNTMGIAIYSPLVDENELSVRAAELATLFSSRFPVNLFHQLLQPHDNPFAQRHVGTESKADYQEMETALDRFDDYLHELTEASDRHATSNVEAQSFAVSMRPRDRVNRETFHEVKSFLDTAHAVTVEEQHPMTDTNEHDSLPASEMLATRMEEAGLDLQRNAGACSTKIAPTLAQHLITSANAIDDVPSLSLVGPRHDVADNAHATPTSLSALTSIVSISELDPMMI
jgi:glutaminase